MTSSTLFRNGATLLPKKITAIIATTPHTGSTRNTFFRSGVIRYKNKIRYRYHIWDHVCPIRVIFSASGIILIRKVRSATTNSEAAYGTPNRRIASAILLQYFLIMTG